MNIAKLSVLAKAMDTRKLYALVKAYEDIGLSHDAAFERAFSEYLAVLEGGAA